SPSLGRLATSHLTITFLQPATAEQVDLNPTHPGPSGAPTATLPTPGATAASGAPDERDHSEERGVVVISLSCDGSTCKPRSLDCAPPRLKTWRRKQRGRYAPFAQKGSG